MYIDEPTYTEADIMAMEAEDAAQDEMLWRLHPESHFYEPHGLSDDDLAVHDEQLIAAEFGKRHTIDHDELLTAAAEHEQAERPAGEPEPGSPEWHRDWIDSMPEDDFPVPDTVGGYTREACEHLTLLQEAVDALADLESW